VAAYYAGLLDVFLIDTIDAQLADQVAATGARPLIADALMRHRRGEARLARLVLAAASKGGQQQPHAPAARARGRAQRR
jgi:hypothetical protein